jgi:hypothetical protein
MWDLQPEAEAYVRDYRRKLGLDGDKGGQVREKPSSSSSSSSSLPIIIILLLLPFLFIS